MVDWKNILFSDVDYFNSLISSVPVLERNMFKGADLSNFALSKAFLKSFDLSESNLTNTFVSGYYLSTCRLDKTILKNILKMFNVK